MQLMLERTADPSRLTGMVTIWLMLALFGPYIGLALVPVRLDHLLFPCIGSAAFLWGWRKTGRFPLPKVLYPFIALMAVGSVATVLALQSGVGSLRWTTFLAAIDNHVRIALIVITAAFVASFGPADMLRVWRAILVAAAILAVFGILQVLYPEWVVDLSLAFYEGRHDRAKSSVELCMGIRAVSTFYSPGNFGLFLAMVTIFMLLGGDQFGFRRLWFVSALFVITFAGVLTISKLYIGGMFILLPYLLSRRRWRMALLWLVLFVTALTITAHVHDYAYNSNKIYIKSVVYPRETYNRWLGPRFGMVTYSQPAGTDTPSETVNGESSSDAFQWVHQAGYLTPSMEVIKKHFIAGVGYVSNVSAGDSMFIHLMVRGGMAGTLLFLAFLFLLMRKVWLAGRVNHSGDKSLREAWIVAAVIFLVAGIGLPTFIQQRTGDVFWWTGALLAFQNNRSTEAVAEW